MHGVFRTFLTRIGPILSAAALAIAAWGCSGPRKSPVVKDVLLITVDTARADRFSYTGAKRGLTPRVDALAVQGVTFTDAISPVPLTLPAHATLMTGRQPPSHTVRDNGAYRLPASETTLAEVLQRMGFATAAFVGAEVLAARYGLDQGFERYDADIAAPDDSAFLYYAERSAGKVVDAAEAWLENRGQEPVFVWVHLFDPHAPYAPPEPERSSHAAAYDGEIAYTDRMIGRLLDRWGSLRDLDRTLVVVTSDHGEALGEHGESTHGVLVHDATLRVPLVIRAPGLRRAEPVDAPVALVDVMPTILTLLGLPIPDGVQGRSLVPLMRGASIEWSAVAGYSESLYGQLHYGAAPLFSLREGGWKLVRGLDVELYDLESDPGELQDRADEQTRRRDELARTLDDVQSGIKGDRPVELAMDDETRRALASLGYASIRGPVSPAAPRDPRDVLASMRRMADADRLALSGDTDAAVAVYREIIVDEPSNVDARVRLSRMLVAEHRLPEAVELLAAAVALAPHEPFLPRELGNLLETLGRYSEALDVYDAGLSRHPGEMELRAGRWRCLNRLRRLDELLSDAERAIAADPGDGAARYARAVACCGQPVEAYIAALERELAELPDDALLREALARARAEAAASSKPRR